MPPECVDVLTEYLTIDTTNPPGNEDRACGFLGRILTAEGISYETFEPAPGRMSLRAVLPGSGERDPLILLNHTDVVMAEAGDWQHPPFGGEVADGFIHGRGALDMKGQGVMELMAFLALKRKGLPLTRDVVFLAVADEEAGGGLGVGWLLKNHPEAMRAGCVLNEGGFGISDLVPGRGVHLVSSAEKGLLWLHLAMEGEAGHASVPHRQNALERLTLALDRILTNRPPPRITPESMDFFLAMAPEWPFLEPFIKDRDPETLLNVLKESGILEIPAMGALVNDTISLTMMHAGEKANVIPTRAEAHLDIRLLPGSLPEDMVRHIEQKADEDRLAMERLVEHPANASPRNTDEYGILETVLHDHFPGALVAPYLTFGVTDSRFFRSLGVPCYGFFPVEVGFNDTKRIHGIDERISLAGFEKACATYEDAVERLATL